MTRYLTIVYRDIAPGDEVSELIYHPKISASSWSHALHERDDAKYEADQLRADTLRYRFLREYNLNSMDNARFHDCRREELDAVIDQAINEVNR